MWSLLWQAPSLESVPAKRISSHSCSDHEKLSLHFYEPVNKEHEKCEPPECQQGHSYITFISWCLKLQQSYVKMHVLDNTFIVDFI